MPNSATRYRTKLPVRVFSVDPRYGPNPYTAAQVRAAVVNFDRYQRHQQIGFPAALTAYIPAADIGVGHDRAQQYAQLLRGDLPNCGEPVRVWMQGADLFAEFDHMPAAVVDECDAGRLRDVSIELYPNYRTADGVYHGPIIKRISLLGSTQPVLKGLRPNLRNNFVQSYSSYSEPSRYGRAGQNVVAVFSEGINTMDRASALAILQAAGVDVTGWDAVTAPDAIVIAFATFVQALTTNPAASPGVPPTNPVGMFAEINRAITSAIAPLRQEFNGIIRKGVEQEVTVFAEANRKKLFPYELAADNASYIIPRLLKMDPATRAGEMAVIANRPDLSTFAESMEQDHPNAGERGQPVTPARRDELLAQTPKGRAIIARRAEAAGKR